MATLVATTDCEATYHLGVRLHLYMYYIIHIHLHFVRRYKILFLDVLFPLSVKKIIFVDADQVQSKGVFSNLLPHVF